MPTYAELVTKFQANTLTEAERKQLIFVGLAAEMEFRQQGSTMIPECWGCADTPICEIAEDILTAIGITAQGLAELYPPHAA